MNLLAFRIKGFDNYFVTNTGGVYSRSYKKTGRIKKLKPMVDINGYLTIDLFKEGKRVNKKIHRLVAEVFISNPEKKPCVNHINGKHDDNSVKNLEWCTYSENMKHSYNVLCRTPVRACLGKLGKLNKLAKTVLQLKNGKIINRFYGTEEAERKTGINQSNICACCLGKRKTAGKYQWKYI